MIPIPTVEWPHNSCDIPAARAVPVFHVELPGPGDEHNAAIPLLPASPEQLPAHPLPSPTFFPRVPFTLLPVDCPHLLPALSVSPDSACSLGLVIHPSRMCSLVPVKVQLPIHGGGKPLTAQVVWSSVGLEWDRAPSLRLCSLLQAERDSEEPMEVAMETDMKDDVEEMEVDMKEDVEEEMEVEEEGLTDLPTMESATCTYVFHPFPIFL
ncbi:uncharacterized protein LOC116795219 [Chiroxiphia lanceolata]|uniref:uncharacterized protein LOC116795219 n=1 Tax=Chiroxiphia lanceolata TaxID=296741 RepID=UPI0013CEF9FE|nr:uncharacterized protein LOC116795219 [Chiroxiphia lanceolata]